MLQRRKEKKEGRKETIFKMISFEVLGDVFFFWNYFKCKIEEIDGDTTAQIEINRR